MSILFNKQHNYVQLQGNAMSLQNYDHTGKYCNRSIHVQIYIFNVEHTMSYIKVWLQSEYSV